MTNEERKALVELLRPNELDRPYWGVSTTVSVHRQAANQIEADGKRIARLEEQGRFLLERLSELEWLEGNLEETARYFFGHVEPAIYHLRAALGEKV